jgi:hypothetical protein
MNEAPCFALARDLHRGRLPFAGCLWFDVLIRGSDLKLPAAAEELTNLMDLRGSAQAGHEQE